MLSFAMFRVIVFSMTLKIIDAESMLIDLQAADSTQ